MRAIDDPSGGTFDAAGDFDRFTGQGRLAMLSGIDPHDDSSFGPSDMAELLADIEVAVGYAKDGPETRGLLRLLDSTHV